MSIIQDINNMYAYYTKYFSRVLLQFQCKSTCLANYAYKFIYKQYIESYRTKNIDKVTIFFKTTVNLYKF